MMPTRTLLWLLAATAAVSCIGAESFLPQPQGGIVEAGAAAAPAGMPSQVQWQSTRQLLWFGSVVKGASRGMDAIPASSARGVRVPGTTTSGQLSSSIGGSAAWREFPSVSSTPRHNAVSNPPTRIVPQKPLGSAIPIPPKTIEKVQLDKIKQEVAMKLKTWIVTKGPTATKRVAKAAFKAGESIGEEVVTCGGCRKVCGNAREFIDTDWCWAMATIGKVSPSTAYHECKCLVYVGYPKSKAGATSGTGAQPRAITPHDLGMRI